MLAIDMPAYEIGPGNVILDGKITYRTVTVIAAESSHNNEVRTITYRNDDTDEVCSHTCLATDKFPVVVS